MIKPIPHLHDDSCRERASWTNCGETEHEHTETGCHDKHGRLRCSRSTRHRHTPSCHPWIYNCGFRA